MMNTIKSLCEQYGLTQTELSLRFGIPIRTVQDWHAGRRTPPTYVVNMISVMLENDLSTIKVIDLEPIIDEAKFRTVQEKLKKSNPSPTSKKAKQGLPIFLQRQDKIIVDDDELKQRIKKVFDDYLNG